MTEDNSAIGKMIVSSELGCILMEGNTCFPCYLKGECSMKSFMLMVESKKAITIKLYRKTFAHSHTQKITLLIIPNTT